MTDYEPLLRRALRQLRETEAQLEAARRESEPAIAVSGLACRFPGGADGPDAYWQLLERGVDALAEVPAERWRVEELWDPNPDARGSVYCKRGGYLEDVEGFDAGLFGITPREAQHMDPQQRLALELVWHALESAGIPPRSLLGSRTASVFGVSSSDYLRLSTMSPEQIDMHTGSGTSPSMVAGRVAYHYGLEGQAFVVDTACSSSLVAVHLAANLLRDRECDLALAGGTSLMLAPVMPLIESRTRMLSPSGRCRPFDAEADGAVRGEGGGVVVLERLDDALAAGRTVLAVIRGSAVGQDGRSGGLTVPNGRAQQNVIRAALQRARVSARAIRYVEAHGTGTPVGDPIEVDALGEVFAETRPKDEPLLIGSVKSNIGHLEACAGVAGLIRVILSLGRGRLLAQLHCDRPNPRIDWQANNTEVVTRSRPFEPIDGRRLAGVSSFGFSGTNAHVIIEAAPQSRAAAERAASVSASVSNGPGILALSATDERALARVVAAYERTLTDSEAPLEAICQTSTRCRSHLAHRIAIVARERSQLQQILGEVGRGIFTRASRGRVLWPSPPRVAFLFPGQGGRAWSLDPLLVAREPVLAEALERCASHLDGRLERPLLELLCDEQALRKSCNAQVALVAIGYALAMMWEAAGVRPTWVMGHSLGELSAACVAGLVPLGEALDFAHRRGQILQQLAGTGAMASVCAELAIVELAVGDGVVIAARNGPDEWVLSGPRGLLSERIAALEAQGCSTRLLDTDIAFHSPAVDPLLPALERAAPRRCADEPARCRLMSTLTGAPAAELGPLHWARHARAHVRFSEAQAKLVAEGCEVFVELGPGGSTLALARGCVPEVEATWIATMPREQEAFYSGLAELHVRGFPIDWNRLYRGREQPIADLPAYPFERTRYWLATRVGVFADHEQSHARVHPLLGRRRASPLLRGEQRLFEAQVSPDRPGFLRDHRVGDRILFPAAGFVEMALEAADGLWGARAVEVSDLTLCSPMPLERGASRRVQTVLEPKAGARWRFATYSQQTADEPFVLHAEGELAPVAASAPDAELELSRERDEGSVASHDQRSRERDDDGSAASHYQQLARWGLNFGPAFRGLESVRTSEHGGLATVALPEVLAHEASTYHFHPALLDACLQAISVCLGEPEDDTVLLPARIEAIRVWPPVPLALRCRVSIREGSLRLDGSVEIDASIHDEQGRVVASLRGLSLRRVGLRTVEQDGRCDRSWFYAPRWLPRALAGGSAAWLPSAAELAAAVASRPPDSIPAAEFEDYARRLELLEQRSLVYIGSALAQLGWSPQPGDAIDCAELVHALGVVPRHAALCERLLEYVAPRSGDAWRVRARLPLHHAESLEQAVARFPAADEELRMLDACGRELPALLRGERDPLTILFPGGDTRSVARVYRGATVVQRANAIVRRALEAAAERLPEGRILRVVEIGAGTGGTTAGLLEVLPSGRYHYTFTDVSAVFTTAARERFAAFGEHVSFRELDVETPPSAQGFERGTYDVVVATNVLHVTRRLRDSLAHARELLAPGGMLVLMESSVDLRWVDLTFGLTVGWWAFEDHDLRTRSPLLPAARWLELLDAGGFEDIELLTPREAGVRSQQAVLVARRPERDGALSPSDSPRAAMVLLADPSGHARALAELLEARGQPAVCLDPADFADPQAFVRALDRLELPPRCLVDLSSVGDASAATLDRAGLRHALARVCGGVLARVQALLDRNTFPPLWLVTSGTQAVVPEDHVEGLAHTPLWGLAQVLTREHPEISCLCVDLDPRSPAASLPALAEDLLVRTGRDTTPLHVEPRVALRGQARWVARLSRWSAQASTQTPEMHVEASSAQASTQTPEMHAEASYLITGGLGGLGIHTARWLAARGARHLVLLSRSAPNAETLEQLDALRARGVEAIVELVDVCDELGMSAAFERLRSRGHPLRGVVHSVGVLSDGLIRGQTWASFERVFAPKIEGAWLLHEMTAADPLDFFVVYSSAVSLLGAWGQSNHTAANCFLDGLAHHRRALGLPALTIDWGPWAGAGAATGRDAEARMEQLGMSLLSARQGCVALEELVAAGAVQVGVVAIDWPRFFTRFVPSAMYAELLSQQQHGDARPSSDIATELLRAPAASRRRLLDRFTHDELARVMQLRPNTRIDPKARLHDLGMDSLMAIELKNVLQRSLRADIRSTVVFDFPTLESMVEHLGSSVLGLWSAREVRDPSAEQDNAMHETLAAMSAAELASALDDELGAWQERLDS